MPGLRNWASEASTKAINELPSIFGTVMGENSIHLRVSFKA